MKKARRSRCALLLGALLFTAPSFADVAVKADPLAPGLLAPAAVTEAATHSIATLRDCHAQGVTSYWGKFQCWRWERSMTAALRTYLEQEKWPRQELLNGASQVTDADLTQFLQWRWLRDESLSTDGVQRAFYEVTLPQIRLTFACERERDGKITACRWDSFEWPFNISELFCTSSVPVLKGLQIQILRSRSLARVAEQRFDDSNAEPSRAPVVRQWYPHLNKVMFVGESFTLEVEQPELDIDAAPRKAAGVLRSLPVFGFGAPVQCEWRSW